MILEVTMNIKVHTKYNSTCLGLAMHQSTSAIASLVDDYLLDTNALSGTNHILQQLNVLISWRQKL
jgi:hypothetical protein